MIFVDSSIFLDIVWNGDRYFHLSIREVEELLSKIKYENNELKAKEMISIPDCYAYFSEDIENNKFLCKIYKTSFGSDRWIMLMKDENEGYALYENPESREYELAWYHAKLEKPLTPAEEEKMITCYRPHTQ
ncbi:MAG: hypothetical protein BZ138_03415 [Methanosphaera sp. rholeuAM270]|nr:MAG: hypothetical protein BZ138_03415 [Methanosphaera sp. rholeuAM270]